VLLFERRAVRLPAWALAPRPRASAALGVALAIACVGAVALGRPSLWASSPALDRPARQLIGAKDGLRDADEAAYAPRWGVVVANEGVGDVLVARDGKVTTLPPPAGNGAELDAVAADDHAIYASLPEVGAIYRYRAEDGWMPLATRQDGLGFPEGMVVVDSILYSVDEHTHRLYNVSLETGHVSSLPLNDKRCVYPEALTFHRGLGELLITDDKLGNILAMDASGSSRVFASRAEGVKDAEDVTVAADGNVFLADPARREVTEFAQNGRIVRHVRFSRMYGDLVGVEVVGSGAEERLYVVSGDASKNDAFVPSALWELAADPQP
jgi:sugar lactone lactonase YvrE